MNRISYIDNISKKYIDDLNMALKNLGGLVIENLVGTIKTQVLDIINRETTITL